GVDGEPLQGRLATRRREVGSLERDRRAGNGAAIFFKRRDDNRADREIDGRDGDTDNRDDTDHDECENASHMFRSLPADDAGATYAAPPGAASLILTAGSEAGDGKRPANAAFSRARAGSLCAALRRENFTSFNCEGVPYLLTERCVKDARCSTAPAAEAAFEEALREAWNRDRKSVV